MVVRLLAAFVCLSVRLSVFPRNISKTAAARITKLTQKCPTMSPGNAFILGSKVKVTRHKNSAGVGFSTPVSKCRFRLVHFTFDQKRVCVISCLRVLLSMYSVNLPTEQLESKDEADPPRGSVDEQEVGEAEVDDGPRSHRSLLVNFRIMFYPTFDWYVFPSQSKSTLISSASRSALNDQVASALQARYSAALLPLLNVTSGFGWFRGTVVERRSSAGVLSLSCARPVADG